VDKNLGGRPPKFAEPSQPITVTLPKRTLDQLRSIDGDRAQAIVKAVDAVVGEENRGSEVEVVEMAPGMGLLVVSSNRSLRGIPWLTMIEVAPMRHLLAITPGTPIEKVEIALMDLIEAARTDAPNELSLLETLREKIGKLRRGLRISKAEILVVSRDSASSVAGYFNLIFFLGPICV
jgi:hypothetical protein